ncbi:MAG: serine/threonine-protein phosphatase [Granulosicoccus sp.]|nr:serine/threonine-protein phosphatase [Granulosicoccus sp.]
MLSPDQCCHSVLQCHRSEQFSAEPFALANGQCAMHYTKSYIKTGPNEDACLALQVDDEHAILAVADGVGGHPLGEMASERQVSLLREMLSHADVDPENLRNPILNAIETCNQELLGEGKGSATTVTVVEISHNQIRPYHVGDSSVLITGQRGRMRLQTVSHSPVSLGIEAGLLDADQATRSEERNIVLNLVGTQEMRIEIGATLSLARFDTLLLCSDGLTDNVELDDIASIIRSGPLRSRIEALQARCQQIMHSEVGYPDDLSLILYRRSR